MRPPPGTTPTSNGTTGTRPKAEIRRELADRFNAAARPRRSDDRRVADIVALMRPGKAGR